MIKITADSTCDLSPEIMDAMDITLAPLHILIGGEEYSDGVDITPTDLIRYVENDGKICKTTSVNVYEYEKLFAEFSAKSRAVIHICISSFFSSCYQNAKLAAQKFDNVYVIDSKNLSTGSGHIVYDAALMAQDGLEPEDICRVLQGLVPRVDASFVINCLDYLYKGGRCSGLDAIGAKLLQIKPCIEVINGKMIVGKKYRGSFERCIEQYVKDRLQDKENIDYSRVFITHCMCSEDIVNKVKELIRYYADFEQIIETSAGCTISNHCGPNTLGILFKLNLHKNL